MTTKKTRSKPEVEAEEMPELDFSKGVRGKHYGMFEGSVVTVRLDPDVAQSFPDSAAVNHGLRELLKIRRAR
jgi:hypothetical protein